MDKIKIFLVSSVKLTDKSAAAITLARHLADERLYEVHVLPAESYEVLEPRWLKYFLERLGKTRLTRWVRDLRYLVVAYLPLHLFLPKPNKDECKAVVLSVACGNGWLTAAKYARRHDLPLAIRFDDWWPDCVGLHKPLRALYARQFRALGRNADLALCISDGMQRELGNLRRSAVVLPVPEAGRKLRLWQPSGKTFLVGYLGNMFDYGEMLGDLAEATSSVANLRIEFRGTEPSWPITLKDRMKASGQLHGFMDGEEFQSWYERFDCYLVAMFFEERQRRRVRTCFATKLLDYSAMGRPIVIWAPEESAIVKWARDSGAARCVTCPSATAVVTALKELADDPSTCRKLGDRARQAYESEFSPERLKGIFGEALSVVAH